MAASGLTLFETPIGTCGIAWGEGGLLWLSLPEQDEAAGLARLQRRFPALNAAAPPEWVETAIGRIRLLLQGRADDLSDLPLDFAGVGNFEAAVYREARKIEPGDTITYGELAARVGDGRQARAVGQALGRNPWPIIVPCHRVTAADGGTGGFSAPGGRATKLRLLELEGSLAAEKLPLFAPRF